LDSEAVARVSRPPEAPPQIEKAEPTFSVDGVEWLYAGLLAELSQLKPKEIQRYPLSVQRRPRVIAEGVVSLFEKKTTAGMILPLWWNTSTNPKDVRKKKVEDWVTMAEKHLSVGRSDPMFPTEDEWLSIAAAVMVASRRSPRVSIMRMMDPIDVWHSIAKAKKADRMLRGITFLGAIANIATAFSAPRLPEQGKFDWHMRRRACAQIEAASLLLVE
jgi:hypothetical protein